MDAVARRKLATETTPPPTHTHTCTYKLKFAKKDWISFPPEYSQLPSMIRWIYLYIYDSAIICRSYVWECFPLYHASKQIIVNQCHNNDRRGHGKVIQYISADLYFLVLNIWSEDGFAVRCRSRCKAEPAGTMGKNWKHSHPRLV